MLQELWAMLWRCCGRLKAVREFCMRWRVVRRCCGRLKAVREFCVRWRVVRRCCGRLKAVRGFCGRWGVVRRCSGRWRVVRRCCGRRKAVRDRRVARRHCRSYWLNVFDEPCTTPTTKCDQKRRQDATHNTQDSVTILVLLNHDCVLVEIKHKQDCSGDEETG